MSTQQGREYSSYDPRSHSQTNESAFDSNFQEPPAPSESINRLFLEFLLELSEVNQVFRADIEREDRTISRYWILADTDDPDFEHRIYDYELELSQMFDLFILDSHVIPTENVPDLAVPTDAREIFRREG